MLYYALMFLLLALIAGALGFGVVALRLPRSPALCSSFSLFFLSLAWSRTCSGAPAVSRAHG